MVDLAQSNSSSSHLNHEAHGTVTHSTKKLTKAELQQLNLKAKFDQYVDLAYERVGGAIGFLRRFA